MNAYDRHAADRPSISTLTELEQLKARLAAPIREVVLPKGPDAAEIEAGSLASDQRRAAEIESKFDRLSQRLSTEHRLAALKGQARLGFDHSR